MKEGQNYRCHFCNSGLTSYVKSHKVSILICRTCSICATYPPPAAVDYERLNFCPVSKDNGLSLTSLKDLPLDWQDTLKINISLAEMNLQKGAKILEIGCGEGILLDEFRKSGFRVKGIEPSLQNSKKAQHRGLDVVTGYFPHELVSEEYDLVVMSQVLEHIASPEIIINHIKERIPHGYLMLTQTNYKGIFPLVNRGKWYAWVPEHHFWHFSPEGLEMFLSRFGFREIDVEYSHLVHRHNIIYKIASLRDAWKDQFTILFKLAP
jgi:2-polyprenyl-3-methyl-5-hydroxy-6-metoxy-1,4-benzoquinol methylase